MKMHAQEHDQQDLLQIGNKIAICFNRFKPVNSKVEISTIRSRAYKRRADHCIIEAYHRLDDTLIQPIINHTVDQKYEFITRLGACNSSRVAMTKSI